MRIVSVAQMKDLESQANSGGLGYDRMMDRAGKGIADIIHERFWKDGSRIAVGLVGSGNNGGDTLIALTYLNLAGWSVKAYLVKERDNKDPVFSKYLATNCEIINGSEDKPFGNLKNWVKEADILIDGLLGTGSSLPLRGKIPVVLKVVRSVIKEQKIVAVDCPSGIDCDSGASAEECLQANMTVCLAAIKQGLLRFPAFQRTGEIIVADIGLPKSLPAWKTVTGEVMTAKKAKAFLPKRPDDAHKGTFGICLVVAGSVNYCGAALLASEAVYRVGTGLVRAAIPGAIYDTIAGHLPEATWLVLPHTDGVINADAAAIIRQHLDRVSALLIGPGLGAEIATREFLNNLIQGADVNISSERILGFSGENRFKKSTNKIKLPPMVVDADGLRLLSKIRDWPDKLRKSAVLTPHPGEMAGLTGLSISEIQNNRVEIALEYAKKWGHVVVLKGALTVTAVPSGKYMINPAATSALATAGTGDVLAGMIAGLAAQGLSPYASAVTGVWLHAQAGIIAAERMGTAASVTARDVLYAIPATLIKTTTGIKD